MRRQAYLVLLPIFSFLVMPILALSSCSQNIAVTGTMSHPQNEIGVWFVGSGSVIPSQASWVFANTPDYRSNNSNLFANSGFEFGWRSWSLFVPSGTPIHMETSNGWENKSGVMVSEETGYRGGLYQYFANVAPNTVFNYEAMIKTVDVEDLQAVVLYFEVRDNIGNSRLAGSLKTIEGTKNWTLYRTSFTTPNLPTSVTVYPALVYNIGEVWLDKVSLAAEGWASNENASVILNWMELQPAWGKNGENTLKSEAELKEIEILLKAIPTENFWGITFISEEIYRTHVDFADNLNMTWFDEALLGYPLFVINNPNSTIDDWKDEMYLRMIRGFYEYFTPLTKVGITWGHPSPSVWDLYYGEPATNFIKQHYDFLFLYPFTKNLDDWLTHGKPYLSAVDNLFPNQKKFWILTRIWDHNIDVWKPEAMALELKNCFDQNIVVAAYYSNNPPFEQTWPLMLKASELYSNGTSYFEQNVYGENLLTGYVGNTYGWVQQR